MTPDPGVSGVGFSGPTRTPVEWEAEFADVGWQQLLVEAEAVTEFITEQAKEELDRRIDSGAFVVISTDGRVSGLSTGDDRLITGLDRVMILHSGEVRRYQVPRTQYPDLYVLAEKADWMWMTAARRRSAGSY